MTVARALCKHRRFSNLLRVGRIVKLNLIILGIHAMGILCKTGSVTMVQFMILVTGGLIHRSRP